MNPLSLLLLRVRVTSTLLVCLGSAGEGEVRGRRAEAAGGRLATGGAHALAPPPPSVIANSGSTSDSFLALPNFGIRLKRLASRFFVVGDS